MKLLTQVTNWGDQHHPKWLDYFRVVLGIVLIWKGIAFALNLSAFTSMMMDVGLGTAVFISLVAHLIIVFHIIGGLFIAMGTHTRQFCLLNLPILLVAVFFVNMSPNAFKPYSEFWLSLSVLMALICFMIEGNGVLSVEHNNE
jgi:putative oxidoreductase